MLVFPNEQDVRTMIDEQLRNLGWNMNRSDGKCNVFQEQPRTSEEKNRLNGSRPDYVLYSSDKSREKPIAIIETKKPGKDLNLALEQAFKYAKNLDAPIIFATDGVFYKTMHLGKQNPLILNGEEVDELMRELDAIKFLENNEVNTISESVIYDRRELIRIFEESNDLLRDEGFRAGIERFGEFSNILFLKLIGELEDLKEKENRKDEIVLEKYLRWSSWKDREGDELLSFVNDTVLKKIGEKYKDEDIFTPLSIKNPKILKKIIKKLDPLNLINIDSDIKGDSFEYFLKQSTATKNDLGEYFTPRHIVKVMVKLLNPQIGETIYDPFCGTGGTLIETFRHISHNMARTKSNWEILRKNTLFGNEITTTARITKMNMILIGDGHSGIKQRNSLENRIDDKFDIVITNMPYSQKTEYGAFYNLATTNGDSICIQHCIEAIDKASENGRMALVVPEGFLFRKDLQKTREYLLKHCTLKSIISLPQGVFLPYTGVKTNILYCINVKKNIPQDHFWYFDVKNDGYSLDNHRRKNDGETDLQKFLAYRNPDVDAKNNLSIGFSKISFKDIKNNDFILVGNRYKKLINDNNNDWEIIKLGDIIDTQSGGTPSRSEPKNFSNGNIRWIKSGELNKGDIYDSEEYITEQGLVNSSAKILPKDSVLVAMYGATVGKVGILKVEASTNQAICALLPNDRILPKFLYCVLKSKYEFLVSQSVGGAQPNISQSTIKNLDIVLPPLEIQQKLILELDSIDNIINNAKKILEEYTPSLQFKEEWKKVKLGEVCKYAGGTQPPKTNFIDKDKEGYIRLLQIRDYKSDDKAVYIPITEKHKTCDETDIMIGRYGPPVFQILRGKKGAYNVALIKTIPDETVLTKDWLYYFLKSDTVQKHIISLSERARQSGVSPKDLDNLLISLPSIDEQNNFVKEINEEINLINKNYEIINLFKQKLEMKLKELR